MIPLKRIFRFGTGSAGCFPSTDPTIKKISLPDELSLVRLFQPHFCNVFKNYGRELNIGRAFHVLENYNCIGIGCFDDKLNFIGCNTTYHTYMENHGFADLSNNPISNCFRSLLPSAAPFRKHHRTKYRIQDGKQPFVSGGKPLPS